MTLSTKLTLYMPQAKRQTRTMVMHRAACSPCAVDDLLDDMKRQGWVVRSDSPVPSPPIWRQCRSCGCRKRRTGFSRYQCRLEAPSCLSCTLGDQVAIVVEAKRRRDRAADSQPKFVPPQPSDTRPTPEKPAFVPPLPKPKVVGVAVGHFVPSFLLAPVDTITGVNTRVPVYTDNEGNSERPKPEEPVFVPPLPEPKVVRVAVEHFEARRHGYTCSGNPRRGDINGVSFVDAGEVVTAFCHDAGWFRITCDRCTSGGMSEWVPRRRFIRRSDLAQEEAFCSEHGEGRCTGDENWFTGC